MLKKAAFTLWLLALLLFTPFLGSWVMGGEKVVALFPIQIISPVPKPYLTQGLKTMFVSRLAEVGLKVVTDDTFGQWLSPQEKNGQISKQRIKEISQKANAQYAIFGTVTAIGKSFSLDFSLLDLTKTPAKLTHVSEATAEDSLILRLASLANRFKAIVEGRYMVPALASQPSSGATQGQPGPFYSLNAPQSQPEREGLFVPVNPRATTFEPIKRFSVRMTVMSMDVGDLDGDGNPEIALISRDELRIYSKAGKVFKLLYKLKAPRALDLIRVSIGDVDGNGKPEIYLAAYELNGVKTMVYEWDDGRLNKLFTKSGHLIVVKVPGRKAPYLLYQRSNIPNLFTGPIYIMGYQGKGHLVQKLKLPRILNTRFYTMTPYDIDRNGTPELIGLGDGDALHIWDLNGAELWKENETIGGTNNAIDLQEKNPDPNMPRIPFNSRLVLADIDGDGERDLVAVKNIPLIGAVEHLLYYDRSYLIGYKFKGAALERAWTTRKMPYCVVDMQVFKNTLFVALQKLKMKNWAKGYSRIVWFDLPRKR